MFNNALRVTISVIRTLDSRLCCLVVFSLMTSLFFGDRYLSTFKSGLWVWKK